MIVYVNDLAFEIWALDKIHPFNGIRGKIMTECGNSWNMHMTFDLFVRNIKDDDKDKDKCYDYENYRRRMKFLRSALKYPDGFMASLAEYEIQDSWQPTQNEIRLHRMKHIVAKEMK